MVMRGDSLSSTLSQYLVDRIMSAPNVKVMTNSQVTAVEGGEILDRITVTNVRGGESRVYPTRWRWSAPGASRVLRGRKKWALFATKRATW